MAQLVPGYPAPFGALVGLLGLISSVFHSRLLHDSQWQIVVTSGMAVGSVIVPRTKYVS